MRWGVLPGVVRALWLWDGEETEVWEARAEAGRLVVATIPQDSPVCFPRALLLCLLTSVPVPSPLFRRAQESLWAWLPASSCSRARPVCLPSSPPAHTPHLPSRPLLAHAILQLFPLHFPVCVLPGPAWSAPSSSALPWFPLDFTCGMGHVLNFICIISATGYVGLLLWDFGG